jgi:hydroxymethylpyrimidine/phosphomethylpyrimidine kinase
MTPMKRSRTIPCALTIAGSDSGGGAGIQADLQTFSALGVHGTSAITCITAQNPARVLDIQASRPSIVARQIEAVMSELHPAAAKTGMLYSAPIIDVVLSWRQEHSGSMALVLDPVMVSTSGATLLKPAAIKSLLRLLPICTLVMPNLDEAKILVGRDLKSVEDIRCAAKEIFERFGCAALVKGGHLRGLREAVDIYRDSKEELLLSAPFVRGVSTHGTGCTYSAAVTAHLAMGRALSRAVVDAKAFITSAIANSQQTARHTVLNWNAAGRI